MKVTVISNSSEAIKEAKKVCQNLDVSLGYDTVLPVMTH